jgi:MraZ protein
LWRKVGKNSPFCGKLKPFTLMFLGEYTYSIDEKKRLAIPAKFRQALGKKAVITRGLDSCLFLYSWKEWEEVAGKLNSLPLAQADARGFARLMLAGAMEADLDKLGRILVPDYLKSYASLDKKTVIAGVYNRIEVWDENKWNAYKLRIENEIGDMAERLKELGI